MLKNKIYNHITIEILKNFITILLTFTAIAWTVRAVNFLDLMIEDGFSASIYFKYSILNITTDLISKPLIPYHDYTTAKAALMGFSKNLAVELGPFGIRVNCVAPGLVYPTEASQHTKENIKEMIISQTPLRRIANPEDIAGAVLFLASDWSKFITGQTIYVDGGLVMQ